MLRNACVGSPTVPPKTLGRESLLGERERERERESERERERGGEGESGRRGEETEAGIGRDWDLVESA